jgi:hypothetical protein
MKKVCKTDSVGRYFIKEKCPAKSYPKIYLGQDPDPEVLES